MRTTTSKRKPASSTPLFDGLDRLQKDAHGPRIHLVLPAESEPPVTPPPSAEERRDTGIQRAADHADRVEEKWSVRATVYMAGLVGRRGFKPFLTEELIEISIRDGVAQPPDGRAWGAIMRALAKQGVIRKMGYAPAKSSNLSPKVLWGRAVPEREEPHPHD